MQDLPRGATIFFWGEGLATRCVAMRLLRGFGGMLPRKFFGEWCNLVRFGAYFHNFFTFKKSVHSPLIIFIKGCNLQCI